MKRFWLLWLLPLLLGAGSPLVTINPGQPRLGEPLRVRIQLPAAGWELDGYPDLGPFRLLEKAVIEEDQLQLTLLPLRPGKALIPVFTFYKGSRSWQSSVLRLDIEDPYQKQEQPAPLRPLPGQAGRDWLLALICLLLVTPVAGAFRQLKRRLSRRSAPAEPLDLMAQHLEPIRDCGEKQQLHSILTAWRFGPYRPSREEMDTWNEQLRRLEQEP